VLIGASMSAEIMGQERLYRQPFKGQENDASMKPSTTDVLELSPKCSPEQLLLNSYCG
jgi:hypothetical protein